MANAIRFLAVDAVEKAKSGLPAANGGRRRRDGSLAQRAQFDASDSYWRRSAGSTPEQKSCRRIVARFD